MKLRHDYPVLATPTGDWSSTVVTPKVLDALNTVNERGEVTSATMAMKRRLLRYGLVEPRGFGVYLTGAGWRVIARYLEQYPPQHQVSYSHGRPSWGPEYVTPRGDVRERGGSMTYSAYCSCGQFTYHTDREEHRRAAVRAHKQGGTQ